MIILILRVSSLKIWTILILMMRIDLMIPMIRISIMIDANLYMAASNYRWILFHSESILLSFFSLEVDETKSTMSPVILLTSIFTCKIPFQNLATMPKLINNIVGCHFEINIMNVNLISLLLVLIVTRSMVIPLI